MTSYFNAWLNYEHYNKMDKKRYITGFTPRLAMEENSIKKFFEVYNDGFLVSIVRDPRNWYASAVRHSTEYKDMQYAINLWKKSVISMLDNKLRYGSRTICICFEELIADTKSVMESLSEALNIKYDDILTAPTFNSLPMRPNTSFNENDRKVITKVLHRYEQLSKKELSYIEKEAMSVYEDVKRLCIGHVK